MTSSNLLDQIRGVLLVSSYERTNDDVRLCVWMFLCKLRVIGVKKSSHTHMMLLLRNSGGPYIPKGAIMLPVVSTSVEYLEVTTREENEFR